MAWLVLRLTGSAAAMGLVLSAQLLPTLILLIVGGAVVDRLPKLPLMILSDLVRALVVAMVALLVAVDAISLGHLLVLAVTFGVVDAFFAPAYAAVLPTLVPADERSSANALSVLGSRAGGIAGPAIGALLVGIGGTAGAFLIDAISFALAGGLLLAATVSGSRARDPELPSEEQSAQPVSALIADVRLGFRTLIEIPWIGLTILVAGVTNVTLAGPIESAIPLLVQENLHGDVSVLGMIGSLTAVGSVSAAVILGSRPILRHRARLIYFPWIALAVAAASMGLPIGVFGVAIASVVVGAGETALGLAWVNALQDHVPAGLLGRVYSLDALGSYVLIPVGYLAAGLASDAFGPGPVFVAGGTISAIVLAVVFSLPQVRSLD
jgi:DHA3 family tetracycline resistance protein-like MFS transporter